MAWFTLLNSAVVAICTFVAYIARITYNHRRKIDDLRKQGMPMPKKWNWITGHLMVLQKYVDGIPPDAAVAFAMKDLAQEFTDTEVFLVDFWPVYPPLVTIFGPEVINQVCNQYNLPKTTTAFRFMKPIAGGPNLVTMNGDEWKYWRSIFNPGFSTGAMLNNVPHIVDSVLIFREKLVAKIGQGMFSLDEFATKLTMEIILKVTLDHASDYQRSPNSLAIVLKRIMTWHSFWDPRVLMNPVRPLIQRYNGYIMNSYIRKELMQRFEEAIRERLKDHPTKSMPTKSVIGLALQAYLGDDQTITASKRNKPDEKFIEYATWQIRLFLFAGTDTTATILVYLYHVLAKHPTWLRKLREEHDQVFGKVPSEAAKILKENPNLLNSCRLTIAVIKEALRLYGPARSIRSGLPGITITDLQGNKHPMHYVGANILHQALHLNHRVWPKTEEFLPERFLVGPEHELYPNTLAFRPFEQGPRNCIGQTLVWNELKIALVLTCRELDIKDAYADFDAQRESNMGLLERTKQWMFGKPSTTLHGERAYQTDSGGLHPVDGYPCYVSWAKN